MHELLQLLKVAKMGIRAQSKTFTWALTGIFAAVHFVLTIFPYTVGVGGGGAYISLGLLSGPIIGLILGPVFGPIAVFMGGLLGAAVNPGSAILGLLTPIPATVAALITGSLRTKRTYITPIILALGIMAFLTTPVGRFIPSYAWMHDLALLLSFILFIPIMTKALNYEGDRKSLARVSTISVALFIAAFAAIMADHIIGSFIGVYYFQMVYGFQPDSLIVIFGFVMTVYPLERIVAIIVTTIVLVSLDVVLSATNFILPTSTAFSEGVQELEENDEASEG